MSRRAHIKRAKILRGRQIANCSGCSFWPMRHRWLIQTGRLWQALRGGYQD